MDVDLELIELIKEFHEKLGAALKPAPHPYLREYGFSELRCLEVFGRGEDPNVSFLAGKLALTRGAVCKVVKKLLERGDIYGYQVPANKKEIYYHLTDRGRQALEIHARRRRFRLERELAFLRTIAPEDKRAVLRFLKNYNRYLSERAEGRK